MSLLASYFVANSSQAEAIARDEASDGGMVDGPPLLPTELGELQKRLIGHESWSLIGDAADRWVIRVGDDFAAMIAGLPDPIGDDVADEFQLSSNEVDALEVMRPLAGRAIGVSGFSVYMLVTL